MFHIKSGILSNGMGGKFYRNTHCSRASVFGNKIMSKGMKVIEYGGYAALAVELLDAITDFGLEDEIVELMDSMDLFDFLPGIADGADVFDGFTSMGLGIAASRLVRYAFKEWNKDDMQRLENLVKKTAPKKTIIALLNNGAQPQLLLGPYIENTRG